MEGDVPKDTSAASFRVVRRSEDGEIEMELWQVTLSSQFCASLSEQAEQLQ